MNKAFLYEMLRTESVSGGEIPLQKKVAAYMREQGAEVETDLAGDVISSINSASPFRVLLCGHIDEIGFRVTHITDDGYLQVGKAGGILDQIRYICPLHGPVWRKDLGYFIDKYDKWSRYEPEVKGVLIVYASMYGNTEAAAQALAAKLCERGITDVALYDVSNTHVSYLIAESFKYSHIVLASVTYNLGIYPVMKSYLEDMKALNLQNRTFAIIENGSWACKSGDLMQAFIDEELKNMTVLNERLSLASSLQADKAAELDQLADALVESLQEDLEN